MEKIVFGNKSSQFSKRVSPRATFPNKHTMPFTEFYDTVYLAHVGNCLLEQSYIHGCGFEGLVKFSKFVLNEFGELVPLLVGDFNVDLPILCLIKEINEDRIGFLIVGALFHIGLQSLLQLIRDNLLDLLPILNGNEPVMENPQTFVHPQSIDRQPGIAVELVKDVNTLDYLAYITHVEHIMGFFGSGQEIISYCVVDVQSGQ